MMIGICGEYVSDVNGNMHPNGCIEWREGILCVLEDTRRKWKVGYGGNKRTNENNNNVGIPRGSGKIEFNLIFN